MSNKHHKECLFIPWTKVFEDKFDVREHGLDEDWAADHGIMKCHTDCPVLEEAIEYGRKVVEVHGW